MKPPPTATCGLFGVIAFEPRPAQERALADKYLPTDARAGWHVEGVERRGFVAVRRERRAEARRPSRGDSPRGDVPSPTRVSFHADGDGFTAARGFVYTDSQREHSHVSADCESDARIIHAAFRRHGPSFTAHVEGQFCAAGYDRACDLFWLAVDTFGCARLFYFEREGLIHFSDDPLTLASCFNFPLRPCPDSIHSYFTLFNVPPPLTGFERVRQLPSNSSLVIKGRDFELRTALWSPRRNVTAISEADALDALQTTFDGHARRVAAQSDRLALLFSGGVDSSLLGSFFAREAEERRVTAHALGEADSDELRLARQRAELLRLPFRAWPFACDFRARAESLTRRWQAPVFPFPAVYVDWLTDEVSKVSPHLVVGSGADGIFFGDEILARLASETECADSVEKREAGASLLRRGARAALLFRRHKRFARRFLYTDDFRRALGARAPESEVVRAYVEHERAGPAGGLIFQYLYFAHHSIVAMHTRAVEGRAAAHLPFLSKTLVDFILTLPGSLLFDRTTNGPEGKPLLKKLLLRRVPSFPVGEAKRGFGHSIRIQERLQPELLGRLESEVLTSGLCDGAILERESVRAVFDACSSSPRDVSLLPLAWGIYSLAVWFRVHFARRQ